MLETGPASSPSCDRSSSAGPGLEESTNNEPAALRLDDARLTASAGSRERVCELFGFVELSWAAEPPVAAKTRKRAAPQ